MAEHVTISVDALGGDSGPDVILEGVQAALAADLQLSVILCGPKEVVEPFAATNDRCMAWVTTQKIDMDESPAKAVRAKKDASLVVGCRLVKEGKAQGFFSAGSTGACLAAATLVMGRIKGVKRPAIGQIVPGYNKPTLFLDVGANADCKPEYLVQFAQMGAVFSQKLMGVKNPTVALLNIGEENSKGNMLAIEANAQLRANVPQFVGNCQGHDLMAGTFDVIVTDGFTGNVSLKALEGAARTFFKYVKDALTATFVAKLGALAVKGSLSELRDQLSPDAYGGAPLLGVKGALIVGHGSSSATAVKNGIGAAAKTVRSHVAELIGDAISLRQSISEKTIKGSKFSRAKPAAVVHEIANEQQTDQASGKDKGSMPFTETTESTPSTEEVTAGGERA